MAVAFRPLRNWVQRARAPDPVDDPVDEPDDWEVIRAEENGYRHVIFLPPDEDYLKDEAFVIAHETAVVSLWDHR